jgi:sorbitol-specific phosphotransferase system component IIBC
MFNDQFVTRNQYENVQIVQKNENRGDNQEPQATYGTRHKAIEKKTSTQKTNKTKQKDEQH